MSSVDIAFPASTARQLVHLAIILRQEVAHHNPHALEAGPCGWSVLGSHVEHVVLGQRQTAAIEEYGNGHAADVAALIELRLERRDRLLACRIGELELAAVIMQVPADTEQP